MGEAMMNKSFCMGFDLEKRFLSLTIRKNGKILIYCLIIEHQLSYCLVIDELLSSN